MTTLSLYIHFPFCVSKCRYCDFASRPAESAAEIDKYLKYLFKEIKLAAPRPEFRGRELRTVFFGGGTPSLLAAGKLSRLMCVIKERFPLAPGAEVSLEANPASVADPEEWLARAREAGVNRVTVGIQSLDGDELKFLGRVHTAEQAAEFFRLVRGAGFDSTGADLIYGLPGQGVESWMESVEKLIALNPDHVSMYCLEIAPGTPLGAALAAGETAEAPAEVQEEMYYAASSALEAAGYSRYEISNFARPGHECRHNLAYWTGGDYLGAGLSACSCTGGWRARNESDFKRYYAKLDSGMLPRAEEEFLSSRRRLREAAVMRLRTARGFSLEDFSAAFPEKETASLAADAEKLAAAGLLAAAAGRFYVPRDKLFVSDGIFSGIIG